MIRTRRWYHRARADSLRAAGPDRTMNAMHRARILTLALLAGCISRATADEGQHDLVGLVTIVDGDDALGPALIPEAQHVLGKARRFDHVEESGTELEHGRFV